MAYKSFEVRPVITQKGNATSFHDMVTYQAELERLGFLAQKFKTFWSIYAIDADSGLPDAIGDFAERDGAETTAKALAGSTVESVTVVGFGNIYPTDHKRLIFTCDGYDFYRDPWGHWNVSHRGDAPPRYCAYASPAEIAKLKGCNLFNIAWAKPTRD